ncbi:hypothetical protein MMC21_005334 [Puttea exsequens]|nr:hypothetical protein [Puttea exsequens]
MLHEILLSLSGHPSPLLDPTYSKDEDVTRLRSLLSPAETALLQTLAEDLGQRNKNIRSRASSLSSSHPSTVCRAVATAILSTHLAAFQRRILEVERDILQEDPSMVGAYNIVPLSAIVRAFDGWARKLEWLYTLVQFIQAPPSRGQLLPGRLSKDACTAAELIRYLRDATHTGYHDIEEIALGLVKVAEMAWLKQISTWVLYGRLPVLGAADFLINQQLESEEPTAYTVKDSLVPSFVTEATALSILFIGKSLNRIREGKSLATAGSSSVAALKVSLLPNHLAHLSSLQSPFSSSSFSAAIAAIRLSLSQNTLLHLLPIPKALEILHVLKNFFLLDRGEFAVALITAADERLILQGKGNTRGRSLEKALASMTIKEGEVSAVLARTWAALASMQSLDDEDVDEELDRARELIRLSIKSPDISSSARREIRATQSTISFDDLLLPSSTVLTLHVPSPLDLFLTSADTEVYSHTHSYLLAIRRAHLRLSTLFTLSTLRRDHPSPRPPHSTSHREAFATLASLRAQADQRTKVLRPTWATIGSAIYLLTELGEYFQGEVVKSSWSTFHSWLVPNLTTETRSGNASLQSSIGSAGRAPDPRPSSSRESDKSALQAMHDPETLTQAHKSYLSTLQHSLLLDESMFTSLLRRFMTSVDHISALMQRLNEIEHSLNTERNANVEAQKSGLAAEEQRLIHDLEAAREKLASGVKGLVDALRAIDDARAEKKGFRGSTGRAEQHGFAPWSGGGVDRLLLKFDYGNVERIV